MISPLLSGIDRILAEKQRERHEAHLRKRAVVAVPYLGKNLPVSDFLLFGPIKPNHYMRYEVRKVTYFGGQEEKILKIIGCFDKMESEREKGGAAGDEC